MSTTASLLGRNSLAWTAIIRHDFLREVGEGRNDGTGFARWLEQDYLFVSGLIGFVGRLISRCDSDRELLRAMAGAVDVLCGELELFEEQAHQHGANVHSAPLSPVCFNYLTYLNHLASEQPFPVALMAYWALEQAYFDGWCYVRDCGSAGKELAGFIVNWTCPEFGAYVELLRSKADGLLKPEHADRAGEALLQVIRYEHQFWDLGLRQDSWSV
ncbi:hypothetical protein KDL29_12855 [bacterium]|nr:hypothetical protein [bacterium]